MKLSIKSVHWLELDAVAGILINMNGVVLPPGLCYLSVLVLGHRCAWEHGEKSLCPPVLPESEIIMLHEELFLTRYPDMGYKYKF